MDSEDGSSDVEGSDSGSEVRGAEEHSELGEEEVVEEEEEEEEEGGVENDEAEGLRGRERWSSELALGRGLKRRDGRWRLRRRREECSCGPRSVPSEPTRASGVRRAAGYVLCGF